MRIVAYFIPPDDSTALQADLLQRHAGARVNCRNAHFWHRQPQPEPGYTHVYAPGFPGIVEAYIAAGAAPLDALPDPLRPRQPRELAEIGVHEVVTILCPGRYLREELAAFPAEGLVIAVNEAGFVAPHDWIVANDGYVDSLARYNGQAIRACRRVHESTLPTCDWFALDRLKIKDGTYTVRCALVIAEAMQAKRIRLIGHDLTVGKGVDDLTHDWPEGQLEACRKSTRQDLLALAKAGVQVEHIRWDEKAAKAYVDTIKPK